MINLVGFSSIGGYPSGLVNVEMRIAAQKSVSLIPLKVVLTWRLNCPKAGPKITSRPTFALQSSRTILESWAGHLSYISSSLAWMASLTTSSFGRCVSTNKADVVEFCPIANCDYSFVHILVLSITFSVWEPTL